MLGLRRRRARRSPGNRHRRERARRRQCEHHGGVPLRPLRSCRTAPVARPCRPRRAPRSRPPDHRGGQGDSRGARPEPARGTGGIHTLGAGFDISARDLDLRGTGELLGDEQAGHVQTIGIGLYRKTWNGRRGGAGPAGAGRCPAECSPRLVGDDPSRLRSRTGHAARTGAIARTGRGRGRRSDALRVEIEDRFGPMPQDLEKSFTLAELRLRCASLGVAKLDLGTKAGALSFTPSTLRRLEASDVDGAEDGVKWSKQRLVFAHPDGETADPIAEADGLLDRLESMLPAVP